MSAWVLAVLLLLAVPGLLVWLTLARFSQLKAWEWFQVWKQYQDPTPEFFRSLLRFTLKTGRMTRHQLAGEFEVSPTTIDRWAEGLSFTPAMPLRRHIVKVLRKEWSRDRRKG